jgi:hypothetical protein
MISLIISSTMDPRGFCLASPLFSSYWNTTKISVSPKIKYCLLAVYLSTFGTTKTFFFSMSIFSKRFLWGTEEITQICILPTSKQKFCCRFLRRNRTKKYLSYDVIMPVQIPQWTEFLSCQVCFHVFDEGQHRPISLACGHTVCKTCLCNLPQKRCPFDQNTILRDITELPVNYALLQLVGAVVPEMEILPSSHLSDHVKHYNVAIRWNSVHCGICTGMITSLIQVYLY